MFSSKNNGPAAAAAGRPDSGHRQRDRYRFIFQNAPVGLLEIDFRTRRITQANPAVSSCTGYSAAELSRMNPLRLVAAESRCAFKTWLRGLLQSTTPVEGLELEGRAKDGRRFRVLLSAQVVRTDGRARAATAAVCQIDRHKRTEQALLGQNRLERLLTAISTRFLRLASDRIDPEITAALESLGKFLAVDRSYVFLFSKENRRLDTSHEWCAPGVWPRQNLLQGLIPPTDLPWLAARLDRAEIVHLRTAADLPPEAAAERALLVQKSIQSLLIVPMQSHDAPVGLLGFEAVKQQTAWPAERRHLLNIVGEIFTGAIVRQRMAETLRASESRFRSLFETLPNIAVQGYGPDGTVHFWNKASEKIYGYSAGETIGQNLLELIIPPESRPTFREGIRKAIQTGKIPEASELSLIRKDGSRVSVFSSQAAIQPPGQTPEFFCLDVDLTPLKEAQRALQKSEEKFKLLVENANDAVVILQDGYIRFHNQNACQALGYSREGMETLPFLQHVAFSDRCQVLERNRRRLIGEVFPSTYSIRVQHRSGHRLVVEINAFLIHWQGGPAILCFARDISGKVAAARARQQAHLELETRVRERTRALASINRELRTEVDKHRRTEARLKAQENELSNKNSSLEELNTALKVLLRRKNEDKNELEEKVLLNIKELVEPYLFKLKSTGLTQPQATYVEMLITNLNHITSSFSQRLASPLFHLTPTEIQVANHIQQGLSTKEISDLCNLSNRTIESHRKNIRRKLGLQNKKINLRTHLMGLK